MKNCSEIIVYRSTLAPLIEQFIREKKTCGYKYHDASKILKNFDDFLCLKQHEKIELPREVVLQWAEKKYDEQPSTFQRRIGLVRQLAQMMRRQDLSAYVIPMRFGTPVSYHFVPYIFTREEIKKIIKEADKFPPSSRSLFRHIVMPEIFRLLYTCGFRLNEVLDLRFRDVDLTRGVITVRDGKFGKDRLVPMAIDVVERLVRYTKILETITLEKITDDSFFFPSSSMKSRWTGSGIYYLFRKCLYQCDIHHKGRGNGPRVHDLRHTFAVHRLNQWYEEKCDLNAKLPLLVTYLGHQDFTGTQKYLHLTAELFPNLTQRMNEQFGDVISGGHKA